MSVALARKTDERAALRAAIMTAEGAKAALAEREAALEKAAEYAALAQRKLETATGALGRAREAHAERLARAHIDGREPPSATLQDKRDEVDTARDELDAARDAVEQLRSEIVHAELAVVAAENQVLTSVNALLVPIAQERLARAKQLRVEFLNVGSELRGIFSGDPNVPGPMGAVRDAAIRFLNVTAPNFDESVWAEANRRQWAWRDCKEALSNDPDALLPEQR